MIRAFEDLDGRSSTNRVLLVDVQSYISTITKRGAVKLERGKVLLRAREAGLDNGRN